MNVKELREELKLTQQELAFKMGVTLHDLKEGREINPSTGSSVSGIPHDAERFYTILERQQDIMCKQLEELAQFRAMAQKKETQIDMLLSMIRETYHK